MVWLLIFWWILQPKKLRTTLFGHYVSVSKPPAELGKRQQERRLIQYIDTINSSTFNLKMPVCLSLLAGTNSNVCRLYLNVSFVFQPARRQYNVFFLKAASLSALTKQECQMDCQRVWCFWSVTKLPANVKTACNVSCKHIKCILL